jgi:hypothetical protein
MEQHAKKKNTTLLLITIVLLIIGATTMVKGYTKISDNVIFHLSFDDNTTSDSSPNNLSVLDDSTIGITGANCSIGGCRYFDADTDSIRLGEDARFNDFVNADTNFTVNMWVKIIDKDTWDNLFSFALNHSTIGYASNFGMFAYGTGCSGTNFGYYEYGTPTSSWFCDSSLYDAGSNLTMYTYMSFRNNSAYIYINGTLKATFTAKTPTYLAMDGLNYMGLFHQVNDASRAYLGYIDEVTMWNRSLSANEISSIYGNYSLGCNVLNTSCLGTNLTYSNNITSSTDVNTNITHNLSWNTNNSLQSYTFNYCNATYPYTVKTRNENTTLLSSGFEGNLSEQNFTTQNSSTDGRWNNRTDQKNSGSYSAKLGENIITASYNNLTSLEVNTTNCTSIFVQYYTRDDDLDDADDPYLLYYNSSGSWVLIKDESQNSEDSWVSRNWEITDSQYKHSNFSIRFQNRGALAATENWWIDDVNIVCNIVEYTDFTSDCSNASAVFTSAETVSFSGTDNISQGYLTTPDLEGYTVKWCINAITTSGYINNSCSSPFSYILTSGEPPVVPNNTCTYTSGNWVININDDCNITDNIDLNRNDLTINGTGATVSNRLYVTGSIKNFSNVYWIGSNNLIWGVIG